MKNKHIFSLLDQSFTTVHVAFDNSVHEVELSGVTSREAAQRIAMHQIGASPIPKSPDDAVRKLRMRFADDSQIGRQLYVYKVPKAWDVKQGDALVVLNDNNQLKIVTVAKVDLAPDIDVDADFSYKWAVSKVDLTEFNELVNREKEFSTSMLEVERTKQRESLVNSFRDSLPEGSEARRLFEQTTATLTPPSPPAATEAPPHAPNPDEGHLR